MKRILLHPFVVLIASTQVVIQGGHSCFLLSPASDVPVLPALQEQHLELEWKMKLKELMALCSCNVVKFKGDSQKSRKTFKFKNSAVSFWLMPGSAD